MNMIGLCHKLTRTNIFRVWWKQLGMSDPPLMDSSDCYATWSGPPTEDRGSVASKGKTVGFEKQNSVDQDMVRVNGAEKCMTGGFLQLCAIIISATASTFYFLHVHSSPTKLQNMLPRSRHNIKFEFTFRFVRNICVPHRIILCKCHCRN